ncbi:hypothetical protein [Cystobacter fuscus]|uniref:hypothetical protein n=1 Tax=Cystobacter fuscus TaxID=43 RepID=UPI0012DF1F6D|nr:hypothetical protein [Cystobacter fuscus]
MKTKLTSAQEFVQRLDAVDAQAPMDDAQIKATLREAGVAPGELVAQARAHIKSIRKSLAADRLANAEAARRAEEERLLNSAKKYVHFSLEEIRGKLRQLAAKLGNERMAVAHKNLTSGSSREELEELLAEYEHLEAEHTNGKD